MEKSEAIRLLGGTATSAAKAIGITPQAVSGWPEELPPAIRDRVQAALWRKQAQTVPAPTPSVAPADAPTAQGHRALGVTQADIDHAICGAARPAYAPRGDGERRTRERRHGPCNGGRDRRG